MYEDVLPSLITLATMSPTVSSFHGKIDEAYSPGSEATRMTTVMIVGGRADDAFYEMAHVWSVRPYRSRRFLRMTGANSIPTHRTTTSIPIHLLPTRLCMGISLNWISSTLKNESHLCLSGGSNCTSSGFTQLMHRGFSLIQQMQFSQQAQGQHSVQSDSLI